MLRSIRCDCTYEAIKQYVFSDLLGDNSSSSLQQKLWFFYSDSNDDAMEMRGMEMYELLVAGTIYGIEHETENDRLEYDFVKLGWFYTKDFEEGDFEKLFEQEDLALLKQDIEKVKQYVIERYLK